ncbi:MAG: DUF222 domain-containing protein [Acidimicrobiia bacterium]
MFDTETTSRYDLPIDDHQPSSAPEPIEESDPLIVGLDELEPGLMLAVTVASIDRDQLTGHDRVSLLKARSRLRSWLDAEIYADIASISDAVDALPFVEDEQDRFETTSTEIRAALSLTRRGAEIQTELAEDLCRRLPQVWESLAAGLIDVARARIIIDQISHLPVELARQIADEVLTEAPESTTGQLRARIRRLVISADPAAALDRYRDKVAERLVVCEPSEDGTADLCGHRLPPDRANAAMRRINRLARIAKSRGDRRPIDQIRADLYLDILTGHHQAIGHDKPVAGESVEIRAELTTLLGLNDNPGQIPGWGPVLADLARQVTERQHGSEWRFTITEGDQPIGVYTTRRRPTVTQKREVQALNPTCVFKGCRINSTDCDINHEVPWAQAHRTAARELSPLCRHDHVNHHRRGWKLKRVRPGVYRWTSPLGHVYETRQGAP